MYQRGGGSLMVRKKWVTKVTLRRGEGGGEAWQDDSNRIESKGCK